MRDSSSPSAGFTSRANGLQEPGEARERLWRALPLGAAHRASIPPLVARSRRSITSSRLPPSRARAASTEHEHGGEADASGDQHRR